MYTYVHEFGPVPFTRPKGRVRMITLLAILLSVPTSSADVSQNSQNVIPTTPATVSSTSAADESVRLNSIKQRIRNNPKDADAFEALVLMLDRQDPVSRANVAAVIGILSTAIDPSERPRAVSVLTKAIQDQDHSVRRNAIYALGQYRQDAAPAIPDLTSCLSEVNSEISFHAAQVLGGMGPLAKPAVPKLIEALKTGPILPTLGLGLGDEAARALGRIGPDAKAALPALKDAATRFQGTYGIEAAAAVALIDPGNQEALKVLDAMMEREPPYRRGTIVARLAEIGRVSPGKVSPLLKKALDDPDKEVREYAKYELEHLIPTEKKNEATPKK